MKRIAFILWITLVSGGWLMANHWTPNSTPYENNMTLTGIVRIDGVEQQTTDIEVGAFCDDECRGSARLSFFPPTQHYIVQILIYGNNEDVITFRLYDHGQNLELDLIADDVVTFTSEGYGSLVNPYLLNFYSAPPGPHTVTVSANPQVGGIVTGGGTYNHGATATITATANEDYRFVSWTKDGDVVSNRATFSFVVTEASEYVANFELSIIHHWIPNTIPYESNMTLTGVIQINGQEQYNPMLEVGVFCEEECRGSGVSTYFDPMQRYVVQILIYGESGDNFTFRLYDHELNEELELYPTQAVTFTPDGCGSLASPHVLNFTEEATTVHSITATVNVEGYGTISGTGTYLNGTTCTLSATANDDYQFFNWTENGLMVSTSSVYVFEVTSDRNLVANFVPIEGNHWIPNTAPYENNMTLTGIVQINSIEQQTTALEVGAFCGEECRGTGRLTFFPLTQRYVIQMVIYGNVGEQMTFSLYHHALEQELDLTSPDAVSFVANGYGSLGNPYVLNFTGYVPFQAFHFITAGNWSNAANWQYGALPGVYDIVFIDADCQLDMNTEVAELTVSNGQSLTLLPDKTLTVTGDLTNTSTEGLVIKDGAQLVNASGNVAATMEKDIAAFSDSNPDAWYTIASPMNEMPIEGSSFATPEFDLYRFNESNLTNEEWENYKGGLADFTTFENGRGYLFANSNAFSPAFTGTLNASAVSYSLSYTERPNDPLSGFNLIGNPFPHDIYKGEGAAIDNANLASGYYTLTNEGTWQVHTFEDAIHPGQGILVKATAPTILTIAKSTAVATSETGGAKRETSPLTISVKGENGMNQAFVYFGRGNSMEKLGGFVAQEPSLWVRDNGKDYAIAHMEKACETLELCFSSKQSGDFILTIDRNETEFEYLQLVDHVTGLTVDLLTQPTYGFHVTGQEPDARFSIRFKVTE